MLSLARLWKGIDLGINKARGAPDTWWFPGRAPRSVICCARSPSGAALRCEKLGQRRRELPRDRIGRAVPRILLPRLGNERRVWRNRRTVEGFADGAMARRNRDAVDVGLRVTGKGETIDRPAAEVEVL